MEQFSTELIEFSKYQIIIYDKQESLNTFSRITNETERNLALISIEITNRLLSYKPKEFTLLEEKRSEIELSGVLPTILLNCFTYIYYLGLNEPSVLNESKLKDGYKNIHELSPLLSKYEKRSRLLCQGMIHIVNSFENSRNGNIEEAYNDDLAASHLFKELYTLPKLVSINGGMHMIRLGKLDEAEHMLMESWKQSIEIIKKKHDAVLIDYSNLIGLYSIQGRYSEAKDIIEEGNQLAKKFENHNLLIKSITESIELSVEVSDLIHAESKYQELVKEYERIENKRLFYLASLNLCHLYHNIFLELNDKTYLEKVDVLLSMMEEDKETKEDEYVKNLIRFQRAKLQSYGNLISKAKAMITLEELSEYFSSLDVDTTYLDLLFQDYLISESNETFSKIDKLMEKIHNLSLVNNPMAVKRYTKQQLLTAQYQFYISQDLENALNILYNLKKRINELHLDNLLPQVENEILKYEQELTRWDKNNTLLKKQIQTSKVLEYLKQARRIVEK